MAYQAKRDGVINTNELGTYIRFHRDNKLIEKLAKADPYQFHIYRDGIDFFGGFDEFARYLEPRARYYGKIHGENQVRRIYLKKSENNIPQVPSNFFE